MADYRSRGDYDAIEVDAGAGAVGGAFGGAADGEGAEPSKVERVKNEVDRVKDLMVSNIDALLKRGDRLDHIVDKTDVLTSRSVAFKQSSRVLSRRMWWQNVKVGVGIAVTVVVFIYIIVTVSCGGISWPTCIPKNATHSHALVVHPQLP